MATKIETAHDKWQHYYVTHREELAAKKRAYFEHDPDGSRQRKRRLRELKYAYKRSPTVARALTLYAFASGITRDEVTISVAAVKAFAEEYIKS